MIAVTYDKSKNPDGVSLPDVPLADIEHADWEALPDWLKASALALGCYTMTETKKSKPAKE
jgi:hypothetical protein